MSRPHGSFIFYADVAHLVERHLAKVEVASSSLVIRSIYAPVAQLDRVSGYEPEGQGFESLRARQKPIASAVGFLFCRVPSSAICYNDFNKEGMK